MVNWLAPNFFGYGNSTAWPREEQREPCLADQAALVCAAVDDLVPAGASVHILAHSYGGSIALAACAHLAETRRVASLVLFEPNSFFLLSDADRVTFAREVRGWLELLRNGDDEAFMSNFYSFWFGAGAWEVLPKKTAAKLRESLRDLDLELIATVSEIEAGSAEAYWAMLNGPLAAVPKHALRGNLGTHARTLELLERLRTHGGFHIHETTALGSGHLAPFTHADIVLPEMLGLCAIPVQLPTRMPGRRRR